MTTSNPWDYPPDVQEAQRIHSEKLQAEDAEKRAEKRVYDAVRRGVQPSWMSDMDWALAKRDIEWKRERRRKLAIKRASEEQDRQQAAARGENRRKRPT